MFWLFEPLFVCALFLRRTPGYDASYPTPWAVLSGWLRTGLGHTKATPCGETEPFCWRQWGTSSGDQASGHCDSFQTDSCDVWAHNDEDAVAAAPQFGESASQRRAPSVRWRDRKLESGVAEVAIFEGGPASVSFSR